MMLLFSGIPLRKGAAFREKYFAGWDIEIPALAALLCTNPGLELDSGGKGETDRGTRQKTACSDISQGYPSSYIIFSRFSKKKKEGKNHPKSRNDCLGLPGSTSGKENTYQCRKHERWGSGPWVGKTPWKRIRQPTPVFLPGEAPQNKRTEENVWRWWRERPGRLRSKGSQSVRYDWSDLIHTHMPGARGKGTFEVGIQDSRTSGEAGGSKPFTAIMRMSFIISGYTLAVWAQFN